MFLPPANEVWFKVICLQVCLSTGGGVVWSWGVPGGDPPRLLLRAVRIILECILVAMKVVSVHIRNSAKIFFKTVRQWFQIPLASGFEQTHTILKT